MMLPWGLFFFSKAIRGEIPGLRREGSGVGGHRKCLGFCWGLRGPVRGAGLAGSAACVLRGKWSLSNSSSAHSAASGRTGKAKPAKKKTKSPIKKMKCTCLSSWPTNHSWSEWLFPWLPRNSKASGLLEAKAGEIKPPMN